jgi:hypothetical protein
VFYFQHLLTQGLAGIDRMSIIPAVTGIAYTILLIGFLIGLYQAAMRGGDVHALGITAIKYLVIAILLANWSTVFKEVNDGCYQIAVFIGNSSGAGDVFISWLDQLKQQFDSTGSASFWTLISNAMAALITVSLTVIAYLVYVIALVVFGFFYTLYGCVLYVLGPLVLALLPIAGVGQLAKSFATNLMIWNSWAILYAIFGALISAIQANRITDLASFLGFFTGDLDSTVLGLISIMYAIALMLIPFIAKRLITGDVGSTAQALVRAAAVAVGTAISAGAGFAAGAGAGTAGAGAGAGAGASGASGGGSIGSAGTLSSSSPPPEPSIAQMIRSGVESAVGGEGAPPAPSDTSSSSDSSNGSSGRAAARSSNGGFPRASSFRPAGTLQTMAFHAGRFAGKSVANAGNDNEDDE